MKRIVLSVGVVAVVLAGATRAHAQSSMDAFHGYLTGQAAWATGGDVTSPAFTPAFTVSVQEYNGWGAEFDFGYSADADAGLQELDLATYMFNANFIQPRGRWRPFVSAGVGVMQNIHAAFACGNVAILEIPPLAGPLHTEIWGDGYRFENGCILPPQAPGLGVRLTDEVKAKFPFVAGSGEWNTVPGGKGVPR